MIYCYLAYGFLTGSWLLFDAYKNNVSMLFPLISFIFPFIIPPYYFIKIANIKSIRKIIIWCLTLFIFVFIEYAFMSGMIGKYSNASSVVKGAVSLQKKIKKYNSKLYKNIRVLDKMSRSVSQPSKMKRTIDQIEKTQEIISALLEEREFFLSYIEAYAERISQEDKDFIVLKNYYKNRMSKQYIIYLKKYLDDFLKMLDYAKLNSKAIMKRQEPEKHTYDTYYMRYRVAYEKYDKISKKHDRFKANILAKYPNVSSLLPKKYEVSLVSLWTGQN